MIEDLKFELEDETRKGARIKVVGIGGAGSNAVGRMYEEGLSGVEFYVMNTDAQALQASLVPNKLQIGARITNGLGAGSKPEVGRQAALEDTEAILDMLEGADMVFVTAGMGHALIGMASARGSNAAVDAARGAISSPLLEDTQITGARQILLNITASEEIGLHEVSEACSVVREASGSPDLQLNFGVITR